MKRRMFASIRLWFALLRVFRVITPLFRVTTPFFALVRLCFALLWLVSRYYAFFHIIKPFFALKRLLNILFSLRWSYTIANTYFIWYKKVMLNLGELNYDSKHIKGYILRHFNLILVHFLMYRKTMLTMI